MPKVMLVEDDNNLREIYDARLAAEGYEIVSAHDGEEALALAVKEKPDLIISDVMMPKISGFDMLDILRSTPETKNTKVIMMTALSQAEDRERADKLGADRYLIKSQVTLEDVIKVAHEVLNDSGAPAPMATVVSSDPAPVVAAPTLPAEPTPAPDPVPATAPEPVAATPDPVPDPAPTPLPAVQADEPPTVTVTPDSNASALDDAANAAPQTPPTPGVAADEPPTAPFQEPTPSAPPMPGADDTITVPEPVTPTTEEPIVGKDLSQTEAVESDGVEKQIQDFIANNPTLTSSAEPSQPTEPEPVVPAAEATNPTPPEALSNPVPANATSAAEAPSHKKLVLAPTDTTINQPVDLNALLEKENQKDTANQAIATPPTDTVVSPSDIAL
jgi:CheY-like chemotaxis protein